MSNRGDKDSDLKVKICSDRLIRLSKNKICFYFRCDDNYDKECKGESTMPFYRAQYDTNTGQSPNMPREQVQFAKRGFVFMELEL